MQELDHAEAKAESPPTDGLRREILELVLDAADGAFTEANLRDAGFRLTDAGLDSLGFMRLIDALDNNYGIYLDFGSDFGSLASLDAIHEIIEPLVRASS